MPETPSDQIVYEAPDSQVQVEVRLDRDTVWLRQAQMAELFGRERSVVTKHVRNVFKEGKLSEESNVHSLHIPGSETPVGFYSLDVIISGATGSSLGAAPNSASGRPPPCATTCCVATR